VDEKDADKKLMEGENGDMEQVKITTDVPDIAIVSF